MSIINLIVDDDWTDKCAVCIALQKGWNMAILQKRLESIDKDGRSKKVDVLLTVNSDLPFNDAICTFQGSDVCLTHMQPITYQKPRSSGLVVATANAPPENFRRS